MAGEYGCRRLRDAASRSVRADSHEEAKNVNYFDPETKTAKAEREAARGSILIKRDPKRPGRIAAGITPSPFRVVLDGVEVGKVRSGECVRFEAVAGRHELRLEVGGGCSSPLELELAAGEEVQVRCWANARVLTALYWATVGRSRFIGCEVVSRTARPT